MSGSRRGTRIDASTERVRLLSSLRLATDGEVTSLEDESSACFFLHLEAWGRARRTIVRTRATMRKKPPTAQPTNRVWP